MRASVLRHFAAPQGSERIESGSSVTEYLNTAVSAALGEEIDALQ